MNKKIYILILVLIVIVISIGVTALIKSPKIDEEGETIGYIERGMILFGGLDSIELSEPVYNCREYTDKQIILSYKNETRYWNYEDCTVWEAEKCVFDIDSIKTEIYENGTCRQCFNIVESYIISVPVYGTEQICEIQNRDGIELTDGYVNFTKLNVVGNVKNNILTLKDLSRGGSFKDHNLDECYNQGVPCTQIKLDTLNYISLVKDTDKISIEKEIESIKLLVANEIK